MRRNHPAEDVPFHPIEHAIISRYLRVRPPPQARGIDIWEHVEPNPEDLDEDEREATSPDAPVVLRPAFDCDAVGEDAVGNAVCRLLLECIQSRLPQWAVFGGEGGAYFGRACDPRKRRPLTVVSQVLFTINWADSGPGISWPESYSLGYLPGYHRYVVISSRDTAETFGYCDLPVRHFSGEADPMYMAKRAIIGEWRRQRQAWGQTHWQDYWGGGAIDEEEALRWSRRVWESRDPNEY